MLAYALTSIIPGPQKALVCDEFNVAVFFCFFFVVVGVRVLFVIPSMHFQLEQTGRQSALGNVGHRAGSAC